MPDTADLLPLIEETLELQRETHTKVSGIEIQLRSVADKVEKHDVSLYHADGGGIIGHLARVEDRLTARIKAIEDKIAPMLWVGGIVGGVTLSWIVGQLLGLIKQ